MNVKKWLAGTVAASMLTGAVALAIAAPASATEEGVLLDGGIYWFDTVGPLSVQSAATQITSGVNATNGGNLGTGRPWATLTTENACPATSTQLYSFIRIPQVGVPEIDWEQVQVGAAATLQEDGRFYTTTVQGADRLAKPSVMTYLAAHGNTADFPFISVCRNAGGASLGYFATTITFTGTTATDLAWSIPNTALPLPASTTTLAASATTVELGTSVDLTATVAPAAATGNVEFFAGAVSLGTAAVTAGTATLSTSAIPVGTNSITAHYSGSNAASVSAAVSVEVTPVAARTTTTALAVSPVTGDAYAPVTLTTTVTASAGAANGTVTFKDGATVLGSLPVTAGVVATFTTNVLGAGAHSLTAEFVGTAPYGNSASAAVEATYTLAGAVDPQVVDVNIPAGTITITTPYHPEHIDPITGLTVPANPLHLGTAVLDPADSTYSASAEFSSIIITDTRAGNLGFTASVVSGPFVGATGSFPGTHAGLTGLTKVPVAGNALLVSDYSVTDNAPVVAGGLNTPKVFAQLPAGVKIGTAAMYGTFGVDQVPTSVAPGLYTATVTFTAV